ncbi:MAG TPA: glutamate--cysteine ligase [Mycobacteriales bacterium]
MHIEFASSAGTSLGIEWELELADTDTGELTSGASAILGEIGPDHPKAKYELLESCIEVITGVCRTVPEALEDLAGTVEEVRAAAAPRGIDLLCSGSHPTTDWTTQQISPNPRYAALVENMQWLARRLQIFGVHVHVGVRAAAKAIPIVNALSAYIPHFLALSASSPYWIGTDTGLASARSKVFEGLPTAGLPYQLAGWDQFESFMGTLIESGTIESVKDVWWDIRPHPGFGTVELRICDGLPTLAEVGMVAALAQCLVERLDGQLDRGYTLPTPSGWTVRENKWRAARYGLDATIITDEKGSTAPLRSEIEELVAELMPVAGRLGCAENLATVATVLEKGASYERQRAAFTEDGSMRAVVRSLVSEFAAGAPA